MVDGSTPVRPVRGPARLVVTLMGVGLILYLTFAAAEFRLAAAASARGSTGLEVLRQTATIQAVVAVGYLLAGIGALIALGLWVARAHTNASALAPGSQRFGRGLAAWCVAIPIGSLFLLPMTVADLWRASEPGRAPLPRRMVGYVAGWVVCWVASLVIFFGGNVIRASSRSSVTGDDTTLFVVQDVLLVLLATTGVVLFVRILLKISGWQEDRARTPGPEQGAVASGPQPAEE